MPTSVPQSLTKVCWEILSIKPTTFLDIGIGNGKWGFLVREYTDVWKSRKPDDYKTIIHGIEVYADYITKLQRLIYDQIFIGDVINMIDNLPIKIYDLIIMADVLEHIPKELGGEALLKKIYNKCKTAFIMTPKNVIITGKSMNYNPYEIHVCEWTIKELEKYGKVEDIGENVLLLKIKGD